MKNPVTAVVNHMKEFYKDVFWGPWNQNRVDSWPGLLAIFGGLLLEFTTFGINDLWPMFNDSQLGDSKLQGVTFTQLSIPHSIKTGINPLIGVFAGWLLPIIGARACGVVNVVAIFAFLWLTSYFGNSIGDMVGTYGIFGAISISFMWGPVIATASTWFYKYRSFATSFGLIGGGLGHLIVTPVAGAYAKTHEWRSTMRYISFFCALGLIGAGLTRTRPGYQLDERTAETTIGEDDLEVAGGGERHIVAQESNLNTHRFTLKEVICVGLPTRTFASIFIGFFWFNIAFFATLYMVISYPISMGNKYYSSAKPINIEAASTLFSWYGGGHLIGAFISGMLATKFDSKRVSICCFALASLCGLVWTFLRTYYGFAILLMIFGGANSSINTVFPSAIGDRYFGPNVGVMMGFAFLSPIAGLASAPIVTAISERMNGSFTVPCILICIWHLLALLTIQFGLPEIHTYAFYKRRMEQQAAQGSEVEAKSKNHVESN